MAQDLTPAERLSIAEGNAVAATRDVGKIMGGTGGWAVESRYQAAHKELYDARVAAGIECTPRNKKGVYYILGS
jgi:hypothetical protein